MSRRGHAAHGPLRFSSAEIDHAPDVGLDVVIHARALEVLHEQHRRQAAADLDLAFSGRRGRAGPSARQVGRDDVEPPPVHQLREVPAQRSAPLDLLTTDEAPRAVDRRRGGGSVSGTMTFAQRLERMVVARKNEVLVVGHRPTTLRDSAPLRAVTAQLLHQRGDVGAAVVVVSGPAGAGRGIPLAGLQHDGRWRVLHQPADVVVIGTARCHRLTPVQLFAPLRRHGS